jgi:hypothetical protein
VRAYNKRRRIIVRKTSRHLFVIVIVIAALVGGSVVVLAQNQPTMTGPAKTTKTKTTKTKIHKTHKATGGRCDPMKEEQTDLSGTYTGKLTHGDGPAVDATLTISGNNFTATAGSDTHSGRITAVTTCGYTAVTVMMTDDPNKAGAVSLRAKKVGDRLTLMSVPGEKVHVSFVPSGAKAVRKHKAKPKTKKGAPPPPPAAKQ